MEDEATLRKFRTHFETLALEDLGQDPRGAETIVPDEATRATVATLDSLPRIRFHDEQSLDNAPDLRVIGTLGEGGMGIVRLATQIPLHREVAAKTLRKMDDRARASLLKEAYITGHLEHPNIVPIYTLGRDSQGAPIIIMKRIEGTSWLALLQERNEPAEDLERHLEILLQVSNALRFAHARGIVHRDIKPENVMIGHFGEVYLLDWGIAFSLKGGEILPGRTEASGVAGTPAYMAPEMTRDDAEEVDFRTDVYLLGSTLHEVLTGRTRHEGDSLFELMYSAFRSDPYEYSESVPQELAAIANKACAAAPEERYQSVEDFRSDLQDYLDHRESLSMGHEAELRLTQLREAVDAEAVDESRVHDLFGECRFGFEQALNMWAENDVAAVGREAAFETMARFYLGRDNLNAARSMIGEMESPSDALTEELERLEARLGKREEKIEELEKFAREHDLRTAATSRSIIALVLGAFWFVMAAWGGINEAPGSSPNEVLLENHFTSIVRNILITAVLLFLFRKRVFRNAANRRLIYLLIAMLAMMFGMRATMYVHGDVDVLVVRTAETFLYALTVISVGVVSDIRIAGLSIFYLTSAFMGVLYPQYQLFFVAFANLFTFMGFAWFWRPSRMARTSQTP